MAESKVIANPKDQEGIPFGFEFNTDYDTLVKAEATKTAEDTGNWIVEGYAATSDLDLDNDIISADALTGAAEDLKQLSTVLFNHDRDRSIGKILDAKALEGGKLWVKVLISKSEPKLWQQLKEGVISKFSVRGRILKQREFYHRELKKRVREVLKVKLVEASLVTIPANPEAKTLSWYIEKALGKLSEETQVAEQKIETLEDLVSLLKGLQESDKDNADIPNALAFIVEIQKAADEADKDDNKGDGAGDAAGEVSADDLAKAISESVKGTLNESLIPAIAKAITEAIKPLAETVKGLSQVPGVLETMTSALTALTEKAFASSQQAPESDTKMAGIEKSLKDMQAKLDKLPVRKGAGSKEDLNKSLDDNKDGDGDGDGDSQGPVTDLLKSDAYKSETSPSNKLGMLLGKVYDD